MPALGCGQQAGEDPPTVNVTHIQGAAPAANAHIVKYHVDDPSPDSGYETGNLHILYSDGTEVVETLRPRKGTSARELADNEAGIDDPKVAKDLRTIAWTETVDNPGTSYAVPVVLAVYRSGKTIVHIAQGANGLVLDVPR